VHTGRLVTIDEVADATEFLLCATPVSTLTIWFRRWRSRHL